MYSDYITKGQGPAPTMIDSKNNPTGGPLEVGRGYELTQIDRGAHTSTSR